MNREEPSEDLPPDEADSRLADILSGKPKRLTPIRRELQDEPSDVSDDLLSRINALDYLNTLVGEVGDELPERLGDFQITGLLGRGGMGTVFEAYQETLERHVALKVLAPQLTTDPRMRKRFRTEARANATLNHQHIVPVFGFGEAAGFLYFAMERVQGVSLDRHASAARHRDEPVMQPREAARRFAGVADALAHAHKRGILHRDVKPGNILVHEDSSLALADFGLSKFLDEASVSLSQPGAFLGTLQYAAPEQARGVRPTAAADFYSLGVTMYECLTGRLPIESESTESALHALLHETPRPLRHYLPKAPRDLEAVLRKLLQKEPADRYIDGEELARDLQRVAEDVPVRIRRQSPLVLAWRRVKRHPFLSAAIAVAVILLLTTTALWREGRASKHENLLAAAVQAAEAEPGPILGPSGLLAPLVGLSVVPIGSDRRSGEVLRLLNQAERAAPSETRAADIRTAYETDPQPLATGHLMEGDGYRAVQLLTEEISQSEQLSGFSSRDALTWLRLYRLYLARAVANLSMAVADAEAASRDLLKARMVRPGAVFPKLLETLLDWTRDAASIVDANARFATLEDSIRELVERLPAEARPAVAATITAFAGLKSLPGAELMEFGVPHDLRRRLHNLGRQLGAVPETLVAPHVSMASRLKQVGVSAARAFEGDPAELGRVLETGRGLIEGAVSARSPLRAWSVVFALLEDPRSIQVSTMPLEQRIEGWDILLSLPLPLAAVNALRDGAEALLAEAALSGDVRVDQIRARYALAMGTPAQALEAANRWLMRALEQGKRPEPYLLRFCAHVRAGDTVAAGLDAAHAYSCAIDRQVVTDTISNALKRAQVDDPSRAVVWGQLYESIRAQAKRGE